MAWTRPPDQADALTQLGQLDDLGEFFEFTDLDLNNLPYADPAAGTGAGSAAPGTHPSTPFEELSEMQAMNSTAVKDFAAMQEQVYQQQQQHQQHQHQHRLTTSAPTSHPFVTEALYQATMQQNFHPNQQQYAFPQQSGYLANANVPPTPNSFEMHGETGQFMQNLPPLDPQQRAILEQRYQLRKEDVAFTPMVSPAGTPSQFAVPDYTVNPGAYFSPLTSPALHAQNTAQFQHGYHPSAATAAATSPFDANGDVDMTAEDALLPESATTIKKPRLKRTNTPRTADPLARVRQSPIQKAVKRKSANMLTGFGDQAYKHSPRGPSSQPGSAGLTMPAAYRHDNSSESGSISPEPLSESLMGPPPRPASMTASPALPAQQSMPANGATTASPAGTANSAQPLGKAATPKSFLSMHGMHAAATAAGNEDGFVDIELPAAAAGDDGNAALRPALSQLNTQVTSSPSADATPGTATTTTSAASTPRVAAAARKTPKLGPSSTPASSAAALLGSPITASTPGALLRKSSSVNSSTGDAKTPGSSGRGSSKKRSSISSTAPGGSSTASNGSNSALVSPALRPKISPSIKPLLPEGSTLHSPTHALLLASKSNYQNLLEGNMLPGVSYPDSLSTGLTSKRTSHKVAEQGRRNRINEALKEMQALLPPKPATVPANGKAATGKEGGAGSGKDNGENDEDGSPPAATGDDVKDPTPKDAAAAAAAQAKSNSSKAATVESANEYIRQLQKENAQVQALRKQLENVKMQLARMSAVAGVSVPEVLAEEEGEGEEAAEGEVRKKNVEAEAAMEIVEGSEAGKAMG